VNLHYELEDEYGERYRLPRSVRPERVSVGGDPTVRIVRAYGSDDWFAVGRSAREPVVYHLLGFVHSDHDDVAIEVTLGELRAAVASAVALVSVNGNTDEARLELLGALPITTQPVGIDGTLVNVTIPLLPGELGWRDAYTDELVVI
jgi:hypothetical protein